MLVYQLPIFTLAHLTRTGSQTTVYLVIKAWSLFIPGVDDPLAGAVRYDGVQELQRLTQYEAHDNMAQDSLSYRGMDYATTRMRGKGSFVILQGMSYHPDLTSSGGLLALIRLFSKISAAVSLSTSAYSTDTACLSIRAILGSCFNLLPEV